MNDKFQLKSFDDLINVDKIHIPNEEFYVFVQNELLNEFHSSIRILAIKTLNWMFLFFYFCGLVQKLYVEGCMRHIFILSQMKYIILSKRQVDLIFFSSSRTKNYYHFHLITYKDTAIWNISLFISKFYSMRAAKSFEFFIFYNKRKWNMQFVERMIGKQNWHGIIEDYLKTEIE